MSYGDTINDPGDIKAGGSAFLGITGSATVQSNAGPSVTFDVFDTMVDGIRAIAKIIETHLVRAGGQETVSQVATDYLGTSSNNAENPNVANYISAVASGSGLSANTEVNSSNIVQLVEGILKGEGTASGVTQTQITQGVSAAGIPSSNSFSGNDILNDEGVTGSGFINSDGTQAVNTLAMNSAGQSLQSTGAADMFGNPTATASGSSTGTGTSSIFSQIGSLFTFFSNAGNRETLATRLVLVILGLILVSAAVFAFAKINPATVAKAAVAA